MADKVGSGAPGSVPAGEALDLGSLVDYQAGSVVSRTMAKQSGGTMTLFAFDALEGLSEHAAPFDALVLVLDGEAELTIGGRRVAVHAGQAVMMPANVPHSVFARTRFKMILVMVRDISGAPAAR